MDPILVKAIRAMLRIQAQAAKNGAPLDDANLENLVRTKTEGKYGYADAKQYIASINTSANPISGAGLRNLGRSAVQGAALEWGDEALNALTNPGSRAAISLAGGSMVPGLDKVGQFLEKVMGRDAGEDMRLRQDLFRKDNFLADLGAGLVGGLASPANLLLPGSGAEFSVGKAAMRGAAAGGAAAAVAGAGSGEGLRDRAVRGAVSAPFGMALGAMLPAIVAMYRANRRPTHIANRMADEAMNSAGGQSALEAQLQRYKDAGRGDQVVLGDLDPHLQDRVDFAANINPQARVATQELHNTRQAGMTERLLNDVQKVVGNPVASLEKKALAAARLKWADGPTGYGGLAETADKIPIEALRPYLGKRTITEAWRSARLAGDIVEDSPLDQLMQTLMRSNPGKSRSELQAAADVIRSAQEQDAARQGVELAADHLKRPPRAVTFGDMQQLKRVLDGKVSQAYANGNGDLAESYKTVRAAVVDALENAVPGYKALNKQYHEMMDLERAIESGEDWWNKDSRALDDLLGSMSKPELEKFRMGMASKLIEQLSNARTNTNEAARLQNAGPSMQTKLQTIFGSKEEFNRFMEAAALERKMNATTGGAVGNSKTAFRQNEQGIDPGEIGVAAALHGPGAVVGAGAIQAAKATKKDAMRKAGAPLAELLLTKGAPNIEKLLREWESRSALANPFFTTRAPIALGGDTMHSLFDYLGP